MIINKENVNFIIVVRIEIASYKPATILLKLILKILFR